MEAITREEKLLDGQDLEPITRKEMFIKRIYDKTQYIPEPITREEHFLKKAGESGGDITIEQLTVTENGEYSEQGVAYSPVIVNVPTPPSYLVKDVPNLPQAVASFDDAIVAPIIKLKADIEAVQSGSGEPSPSNVRPISGWDGANVWVQAEVDPTAEADYSISWQTECGTVYGGNFKVFKDGGKWYCTVNTTHGYLSLNDTDYTWISGTWSSGYRYYTTNKVTDAVNGQSCQSSIYKKRDSIQAEGIAIDTAGAAYEIDVRTRVFTSLTDWKAFLAENPVDVVYELATPTTTTFEIDTEIATLLGNNNIFADCGDVTECRYITEII